MRGLDVGVVGGSIAGTATAALLARSSHRVTIFERSAGLDERGAGIGLALPSIAQLRELRLVDDDLAQVRPTGRTWRVRDGTEPLGRTFARQPAVMAAVHWGLLHRALLRHVEADAHRTGCAVELVRGDAHGASITTTAGDEHAFDLAVGADGHRSLVRAQLFPDLAPRPAGYPAWRGIVDEAALPGADRAADEMHTVGTDGGHALFYLVPGPGGETAPGRRRLNWIWYDGGVRDGVLEVVPAADGGPPSIVGVAPGAMSAPQREHLLERAREQLPPWYADVVRATPAPYVQELSDLALDRYADGRVCLVGDAASLVRPHTASATSKALQDAVSLDAALREEATIEAALDRYGSERSAAGRHLVELGRTLGRQQVVDAPDWSALDDERFQEWFRTGTTSRAWFAESAERD